MRMRKLSLSESSSSSSGYNVLLPGPSTTSEEDYDTMDVLKSSLDAAAEVNKAHNESKSNQEPVSEESDIEDGQLFLVFSSEDKHTDM